MAEQLSTTGSSPRKAHPFSRVVRVAAAYSRLVLGYGMESMPPVDALASMRRDNTGWLDGIMVDLLINLLRAYPPGVQVVLHSGALRGGINPAQRAVGSTAGSGCHPSPRTVDLMEKDHDRFADRDRELPALLGSGATGRQATSAPPSTATGIPAIGPMSHPAHMSRSEVPTVPPTCRRRRTRSIAPRSVEAR